ncbi:MAG: hypothetical protein B7733_15435 [Myxococcales bacterium FL481]|nr:MAG: hypothetical protein B7733_15435 [Myxococcales bacterium FL481]
MRKTLLVVAAFACACSNEDEAVAFAQSDAHIIRGDELPGDPRQSWGEAFEHYDDLEWTPQVKTPGGRNQPQNSEKAAAVDSRGPQIVWLPVHWDNLSDETRARMAWHELTHIHQQRELGRRTMARRLSRHAYWRIAAEVPASAQSIEVYARYGATEAELREQADKAVEKYPGRIDLDRLDDADSWYELASDILHERVDTIMLDREATAD